MWIQDCKFPYDIVFTLIYVYLCSIKKSFFIVKRIRVSFAFSVCVNGNVYLLQNYIFKSFKQQSCCKRHLLTCSNTTRQNNFADFFYQIAKFFNLMKNIFSMVNWNIRIFLQLHFLYLYPPSLVLNWHSANRPQLSSTLQPLRTNIGAK